MTQSSEQHRAEQHRPTRSDAGDAVYDVVGIGNALVDVLSHETDRFIERHGLAKGSMTLIETAQAEQLYAAMGPGIEISGGSAANTMAGLASFGSRVTSLGKVADDQLGQVFIHDIVAAGVEFPNPPVADGVPTGRCLIVVTPDAQRTMHTYLGVSAEFGPDDVRSELVTAAKVTYMEGYLFDRPEAKKAYWKAAAIAHEAGREVAISLSDGFCVERHRPEWLQLMDDGIDIVFANEVEICQLYRVHDFDTAVERVRGHVKIAALTRGPEGSVIVTPDGVIEVPAHPVDHKVDTTGAGDLYAAGFLHGYTNGADVAMCARLGSLAAAEVITHLGARPSVSLRELAHRELGW
jgi:sugar/nucleoside kinase (ribokinase family)